MLKVCFSTYATFWTIRKWLQHCAAHLLLKSYTVVKKAFSSSWAGKTSCRLGCLPIFCCPNFQNLLHMIKLSLNKFIRYTYQCIHYIVLFIYVKVFLVHSDLLRHEISFQAHHPPLIIIRVGTVWKSLEMK